MSSSLPFTRDLLAGALAPPPLAREPTAHTAATAPVERGTAAFDAVYDAQIAFVCATLRRLGVAPVSVEDAAQDVFVVVHRRLGQFAGPAPLRAWIYAIALRVARDYRRAARRKGGLDPLAEHLADHAAPSPMESASQSEGLRILHALLDRLSDDKREVFVMAEIEQMTVPEIAAILELNLNTVYARLRTARAEFERAVSRHHRRTTR